MEPAENTVSQGAHPRRRAHISPTWLLLLPAMVAFLVYLPSVGFQLVWDDTIFLRDMPSYRDPSLWVRAIWAPFVLSPNYFRPLALLTFVAEIGTSGGSPAHFL